MRWKRYAGTPGVQAPLSCSGDYVISHRTNQHTVSYRPKGKHVHVAQCETEREAKRAAREHAQGKREGLQIFPFKEGV